MLLSRWFRAIRIAPGHAGPDGPFGPLFEPDDSHVVLVEPDGARVIGFSGTQSSDDIQRAMLGMLRDLGVDPRRDLQRAIRSLSRLDMIDAALAIVLDQLDAEQEDESPDRAEIRKLEARRDDLVRERDELSAALDALGT